MTLGGKIARQKSGLRDRNTIQPGKLEAVGEAAVLLRAIAIVV